MALEANMIHCYQTTDGTGNPTMKKYRMIRCYWVTGSYGLNESWNSYYGESSGFGYCPLRAIWLALKAEVRMK